MLNYIQFPAFLFSRYNIPYICGKTNNMEIQNRNEPIVPYTFRERNTSSMVTLYDEYNTIGLTKREYFAAKAMQGLMSDEEMTAEGAAAHAVKAADALLKELEK